MGEFIRVQIERDLCSGTADCNRCVQVCPVAIFQKGNGQPDILADNEDECTLCNLCLEACAPGAIKILKLYESDR